MKKLGSDTDIAQLLGAVGQGPDALGNIMKSLGAGAPGDDESLAEDEKMENFKLIYDMFVQNQLRHTSHSLEWLPRVEPAQPGFEYNYFLMGTHVEEDEQESTPNKLQLVRIKLPSEKLCEQDILANIDEQSALSKMEVVVEFDHEDEVIKSRAMPQNQ